MMAYHLIKNPVGTFMFVGRVPAALAHEGTPEDMEAARVAGPGVAHKIALREGRVFRTLTWATESEAMAAAAEYEASVGGQS